MTPFYDLFHSQKLHVFFKKHMRTLVSEGKLEDHFHISGKISSKKKYFST